MFVYCWAAAGMQKGALQFRLEEAELRWLTKLFRPHRDPRLAMGGGELADCMHHFVSTATLLNTTTALGFSRETEPTGYG